MAFWKSRHAQPTRQFEFKVKWDNTLSHTVKSCTKPTMEVNGGEYQVGNQVFKYPGVAKWGDVTITFVEDKTTTRRIFQELIDQGLCIPNGSAVVGAIKAVDAPGGSTEHHGTAEWQTQQEKRIQEAKKRRDADEKKAKEEGLSMSKVESIPVTGWGTGNLQDDSMLKGKVGDITINVHGTLSKEEFKEAQMRTGFGAFFAGAIKEPAGIQRITKPDRYPNNIPANEVIMEAWNLKNAWIKTINFGSLDYSSDELITIEVVISYDWCEVWFPNFKSNWS